MAGVDPVTFWTIAGAGGTAMVFLGTAIYFNRRRLNRLYQRLFGLDADDTDPGYVPEMNEKLDDLREQVDRQQTELSEQMDRQHRQVYEKLDEVNGE